MNMLRRIAAYGLARSLRLPWWAWAVLLALAFAAPSWAQEFDACPSGETRETDGTSSNDSVPAGLSPSEGFAILSGSVECRGVAANVWNLPGSVTSTEQIVEFGTRGRITHSCLYTHKQTAGRTTTSFAGGWFGTHCVPIPQCEEEDGDPAGFNQIPTTESLLSGATACYDGCGVYASLVIDGTGNPDGTTGQWIYDGTTCNQGMGDDVQLNSILGTVNGTEVSAPVDSHSLVPDSITMPDGTVVSGSDLDDYMSYITEEYAVVQGDDAAVHLQATASETITITNISNSESNTINIYPGSGATAAPNAGDLNSGNSNGPGADTFPGDGEEPGDGDCDPLTEDCDDEPGDGDCDPETEDCEGEGGGCDPDEETCGGTFLGKALSAKTFGKSTADFMTEVRGTPLGEAIADVEANMPSGGNCPAPTIDLTDWNMGSYTFDTHCVLLEEWRSQIRISMLAFYALLGIFVFLRRS